MNELTCIIVDDEPLAAKLLENFAARTEGLNVIASFDDPIAALNFLEHNMVDIAFLDIQMPDLDGLSLGERIPQETKIIYTTAYKEFAFDSYRVHPVDYLLKPVGYAAFRGAVQRCREMLPQTTGLAHTADKPSSDKVAGDKPIRDDYFYVRTGGELRRIDHSDILFVEGLKDYVSIHLESQRQPVIAHTTMTTIEQRLPESQFLRITRSHIIAMDKITNIDRKKCVTIGHTVIRVTDSYLERFNDYMRRKMLGA